MGVKRTTREFVLGLALLGLALLATGAGACGPNVGRSTVRMTVERGPETPRDASVFIDEEYVGPLAHVAARGVLLPLGEHRITVKKAGYFPWDELVVSDRKPIQLEVKLQRIPD